MIPKIIHQFWCGPPLPDVFAARSAAVEAMNPGWAVHRWTPDTLGPLVNGTIFRSARAWSPRPEVMRAVVARYELLWHFGGIWVDYDLTPYRPFDLLPDRDLIIGTNGRCPDLAVLGATPGHEFIARLMQIAATTAPDPVHGVMPGVTHLTMAPATELFPRGAFYPHACDPLDEAFCGDPVYLTRPCPPVTLVP